MVISEIPVHTYTKTNDRVLQWEGWPFLDIFIVFKISKSALVWSAATMASDQVSGTCDIEPSARNAANCQSALENLSVIWGGGGP
jgi:hypothetical protein